jgi:predicted site-specific integrase-resolvase
MPDLLDSEQLGAKLGLTAATIRRLARRGRIPAIRINSKVIRYDGDEVLRHLRQGHRRQRECIPR